MIHLCLLDTTAKSKIEEKGIDSLEEGLEVRCRKCEKLRVGGLTDQAGDDRRQSLVLIRGKRVSEKSLLTRILSAEPTLSAASPV